VLLNKLEGLDKADDFLDGAADWEIVDGNLSQDAPGVNDEKSTESDTLSLDENTIIGGDLVGGVGDERELEVGTKATLVTGLSGPSIVRVLRVSRDGENGGVELLELRESVVEGKDLSGADKSEVHRVEEEDNPLTKILSQRDILEQAINDSGAGEGRCGLLNDRDHVLNVEDVF